MGRITAEIAPGTDHPTLDSTKQRNTPEEEEFIQNRTQGIVDGLTSGQLDPALVPEAPIGQHLAPKQGRGGGVTGGGEEEEEFI